MKFSEDVSSFVTLKEVSLNSTIIFPLGDGIINDDFSEHVMDNIPPPSPIVTQPTTPSTISL